MSCPFASTLSGNFTPLTSTASADAARKNIATGITNAFLETIAPSSLVGKSPPYNYHKKEQVRCRNFSNEGAKKRKPNEDQGNRMCSGSRNGPYSPPMSHLS